MNNTAAQILKQVNDALDAVKYPEQPSGLYEPIRYVLSLGGKRIRPVLLLMAYDLYKDDIQKAMPAAVGIETYHNYTLLHDDLMDCASIRRGKPTVHKVWNENTAILSGDSMLVLAYRYMIQASEVCGVDILNLFTKTALEIGEGQQYDMNFENRTDVVEEEYIEMIRLKTSVLLACALKTGAMLAGAPSTDADNLYRFGENIGLAFQLQDDYLDVYGDPEVFGKNIGGDILCNKKTYMLINAFRLAVGEQEKELKFWVSSENYEADEKIRAVTRIYDELHIPDVCRNRIATFFKEGKTFLDQVALPAEKKTELWSFVVSLMNRQS